jgi:hypothetical protein
MRVPVALRGILLGLLGAALVAHALRAQAAPGTEQLFANIDSAGEFSGAASLPNPAPVPPSVSPRFWGATLDVITINGLTNLINRLSGEEFAAISPESWARNLADGATWDDNGLSVNHFGHPYHGAAYFNAARANGFGFWGAAPFALAGSLMWEYLGETHRPSTNDILSTTLGGIILGEAVQRLTIGLVDDQARGLSRLMRESALMLFNPGLGVHRLTRGETFRHRDGAPARRTPVRLRTDVGVRRVASAGGVEAVTAGQPVLSLRWQAGNLYDPPRQGAFESFELRGEVSGYGTAPMSALVVQAPMAVHARGAEAHRWARYVGTRYLYQLRPGLQRSEAEVLVGLGHRAASGPWTADAQVSAGALPLAAISSSYLRAGARGRPYDYAMGANLRLALAVQHDRRDLARVEYDATQLWVLDGAALTHTLHALAGELRVPLTGAVSIGADAHLLIQHAAYTDGDRTEGRASAVGLFLTVGR